MAITRKTDIEITGPWLLDSSALLELDAIIDSNISVLQDASRKEFQRALRSELAREKKNPSFRSLSEDGQKDAKNRVRDQVRSSDRFTARKRELVVEFKSGKVVPPVTRFSEAVSHPDMASELATHFSLNIVHGTTRIEVRTSSLWSDRLQINVNSPHNTMSYDIYVALHQWADRNRPQHFVRIWHNYAGIHWLFILFAWYFTVSLLQTIKTSEENAIKANARKLLDDGLDNDNQRKAIELILAIVADYRPQAEMSSLERVLLLLIGLVVLLGVLFSFPPQSRLAIGKGTSSIATQRLWIQFVSKWLVGGVVLSVITAYCSDAIKLCIQWCFGFGH